jgi:hypothetical protein
MWFLTALQVFFSFRFFLPAAESCSALTNLKPVDVFFLRCDPLNRSKSESKGMDANAPKARSIGSRMGLTYV